jgi:hypothetical protein
MPSLGLGCLAGSAVGSPAAFSTSATGGETGSSGLRTALDALEGEFDTAGVSILLCIALGAQTWAYSND